MSEEMKNREMKDERDEKIEWCTEEIKKETGRNTFIHL
jgi:hypothetical protein